jgi:ParB family transcriptional regulator, chromosome partitioning protein
MAKAKKVGLPDFVKSKFDNHFVEEISARTKTPVVRNISLDKIIANIMQPRKDFGDLEEMAQSIKEKGILEPILIRPRNGKFEIVAGERRFKAAQLAELSEVPCIEHDIADNEALEISIIENIQRKDLDIYEQAFSLKSLSEIYGYTHQEIAQKIGKSRVTVSELIRVTDLPEDILERCAELKINSKTFLLELVKLEDIKQIKATLDDYTEEPFSRDKIKELRKAEAEEMEDAEPEPDNETKTEPPKVIRFNVTSEDKAVKIKFDIKSRKTDKTKIITLLEKLIADIKEGKIQEFDFS